jgi:hypothetical protein
MLVLAAGLAASLVTGGAARLEERTVVKSRVYLVKEPSFLATRASHSLQRGEKIQVELPGRGSWLLAHTGKEQGYIHLSYVSRPPNAFKLSAVASRSESLVSSEYTLAVGGFSEPVERTWRSEHPDMEVGFLRLEPFMPSAPEEVEPTTPEPEALAAFAAEGQLRMPQPPLEQEQAGGEAQAGDEAQAGGEAQAGDAQQGGEP